jgi:hypothetical protein
MKLTPVSVKVGISGTARNRSGLVTARPIVDSAEYHALIESGCSIAAASTPTELAAIMQRTLDEVAPTIAEFHLQRD